MANMQVAPYLFFGGRCDEALEFYKQALGAQVTFLMRYDQLPEGVPTDNLPEGFENKVMHATVRIGETTLHAADGNTDTLSFVGFSLSLSLPTEEATRAAFAALTEGGAVVMPLDTTFWSPCFGMVTDRFGVDWMLGVATEGTP